MNGVEVPTTREEEEVNICEVNVTQVGLEEISLSDGNEQSDDDINELENHEEHNEGEENLAGLFAAFDEYSAVTAVDDFVKFDLKELSVEDIMRVHFPNVEMAFMFYNWYASMHGFSARKSKIIWNCKGEMIQ